MANGWLGRVLSGNWLGATTAQAPKAPETVEITSQELIKTFRPLTTLQEVSGQNPITAGIQSANDWMIASGLRTTHPTLHIAMKALKEIGDAIPKQLTQDSVIIVQRSTLENLGFARLAISDVAAALYNKDQIDPEVIDSIMRGDLDGDSLVGEDRPIIDFERDEFNFNQLFSKQTLSATNESAKNALTTFSDNLTYLFVNNDITWDHLEEQPRDYAPIERTTGQPGGDWFM